MDRMLPAGRSASPLQFWHLKDVKAASALVDLTETSLQRVRAGKVLEVDGDPSKRIYFVHSGWLHSSKSTEDGQRQIVEFLLPGDVFDPGSAHVSRNSTDLAALTDCEFSAIARHEWDSFVGDHVEIRCHLNRQVAARYSRMAERMLRLGKASAETRLAYAILELCLRSGQNGVADGMSVHLPLTQLVLGDYAGLSSVHVSRTFRQFRERGILSFSEHMKIVVHDVAGLAQSAAVDGDALRMEIRVAT